jgi:hypothetical protein
VTESPRNEQPEFGNPSWGSTTEAQKGSACRRGEPLEIENSASVPWCQSWQDAVSPGFYRLAKMPAKDQMEKQGTCGFRLHKIGIASNTFVVRTRLILKYWKKVQIMAKRVLNRRELRKANDQAEQELVAKPDGEAAEAKSKKGPKAKAAGAPKVKKPRKKKEPPRMCARWGVFDAGMKQVAIFDYNQRAEADKKIADLSAKKNSVYFLQIVKEPMVDIAASEPAAK